MLASGFACSTCAAQPVLQKLQGCFEPAPKVFARYAEMDFDRCPLTYHSARAVLVARAYEDGERATRTMPAKRAGALRYLAFLFQLKEASNG